LVSTPPIGGFPENSRLRSRGEEITYPGPHYVFYCCLHICCFNTHAGSNRANI